MKEKVIIFGAGTWGRLAYSYFYDKCEILFFVDNNWEIQGKTLFGIKIFSPEIFYKIYEQQIKIIIAIKNGWCEIQKMLFLQYGIKDCIRFNIEIDVEGINYEECQTTHKLEQEVIIEFKGGLGNQMFQYALYKNFLVQNKKATMDLSSYYLPAQREFKLDQIFPNITIKKCNYYVKEYYKKNLLIREKVLETDKNIKADISLLKKDAGLFQGYWQHYLYPECIENELLEDFTFCVSDKIELLKIANKIQSENSISVHIRRGDYLGKNENIYGGICTEQYYYNAIQYICKKTENPVFYFFTDDFEWDIPKFKNIETINIRKLHIEKFEDWYDMYLMSCCKHNIIANSTFSWWGAWLNQNQNKIVVAPKKWLNGYNIEDICPVEWVRI